MEKGIIDLEDAPRRLYGHAIRAFNGLCLYARALLPRVERGHSIGTEAEWRAENDRQAYNAQALASWQAFRFMR